MTGPWTNQNQVGSARPCGACGILVGGPRGPGGRAGRTERSKLGNLGGPEGLGGRWGRHCDAGWGPVGGGACQDWPGERAWAEA